MDVARDYAATKFRDISLVVIDPIALYNLKVLDRAHLLKEHCFENDKCGIMVLPPFAMPPVISRLRDPGKPNDFRAVLHAVGTSKNKVHGAIQRNTHR